MSSDHAATDCAPRMDALEKRIDGHSEKIERHDQRLSLGDVGFAEVRKDIHAMTAAISALSTEVKLAIAANQVNWGQEICKASIFWAVPLIGGGILWSIVHSGAVK